MWYFRIRTSPTLNSCPFPVVHGSHLPYPSCCFYQREIVDGIPRREEHVQSLHLALIGDVAETENICINHIQQPTVPGCELSFQSTLLAFCLWDNVFQLNFVQNIWRKKYEFKALKVTHFILPCPSWGVAAHGRQRWRRQKWTEWVCYHVHQF